MDVHSIHLPWVCRQEEQHNVDSKHLKYSSLISCENGVNHDDHGGYQFSKIFL